MKRKVSVLQETEQLLTQHNVHANLESI